MGRKNHDPHGGKRAGLEQFDRVYVDAPQYPDVIKFVNKPLKTIYINVAARPGANMVVLVPYEPRFSRC